MSQATEQSPLVGYDDLAARWKPPGVTPKARQKWLLRKVAELRLQPCLAGRGASVRYRLVDVMRQEERAATRR
jgi:hypothetical protein